MSFNTNRFLRVVRGETPEQLAAIIRRLRGEFQVMHYGSDSEGHFAYYRTHKGHDRKLINQIKKAREGMVGLERPSQDLGTDSD